MCKRGVLGPRPGPGLWVASLSASGVQFPSACPPRHLGVVQGQPGKETGGSVCFLPRGRLGLGGSLQVPGSTQSQTTGLTHSTLCCVRLGKRPSLSVPAFLLSGLERSSSLPHGAAVRSKGQGSALGSPKAQEIPLPESRSQPGREEGGQWLSTWWLQHKERRAVFQSMYGSFYVSCPIVISFF